jgi:hypothetical protein
LTRVQQLAVVPDVADEQGEGRSEAAARAPSWTRTAAAASRDSINEENEADLCEEAPSSPCSSVSSRRMRMGLVQCREMEVVAPLVSELSGACPSRAESSRGVLLGFSFLLLMIMM